ncbi:MAG: hypothetical protein LBK74_03910 [Treponema sp.]|jgi:hypothetical protein|nr:hypothetical protein [Treponema sp.]
MKKRTVFPVLCAALVLVLAVVLAGCASEPAGTSRVRLFLNIGDADMMLAESTVRNEEDRKNDFAHAFESYQRALDYALAHGLTAEADEARQKMAEVKSKVPAGSIFWPVDAAKAKDWLAQGIAAEEAEQLGIALYWYYNAEYSSVRTEAASRREALETKIKSDNPWGISGNRIQIQLENEKRWPALRQETRDFFKANNPFLQDFILDLSEQRLSEPGINRQNMTAAYTFQFGAGGFVGYSQTDDGQWGDSGFVTNESALNTLKALEMSASIYTHYLCQAELVNGDGTVVARTEEPPARFTQFSRGDYGCLNIFQTGIGQPEGASRLVYTSYALTYNSGWQAYKWQSYPHGVTFTVPIADITDTGMKARIIKVFQYSDEDTEGVFELIKTTDLTQ